MHADEQAIRSVIQTWHERTAQGDVDAVLSLMTEDAMFLVTGHPPMVGKATFEKGLRTLLAHSRIESTASVEEVGVSGDLAYARTRLSVRTLPKDGSRPTNRHGFALTIFCRSADRSWLLKRDANLLSSADADDRVEAAHSAEGNNHES